MSTDLDKEKDEKERWVRFLYFAYKKAKHFVTKETSFVNNIDIIKFEEKLDNNIQFLAQLLINKENLKEKIQEMRGYLYFIPKSFGPNKEPRVRPKVAFPFEYQILWAAVVLRIGEWFDTNPQLKNVYSMRDENTRKKLDWMVPWSFNGRIKRLTTKISEGDMKSSYIQYNDNRLYESHQMALNKFHTYENEIIEKLSKHNTKVYRAGLDIHEFFPTLEKEQIREMFEQRLGELKEIKCFKKDYFDPIQIEGLINILLDLKIDYPDTEEIDIPFSKVLEGYYEKLLMNKGPEERSNQNESIIKKLLAILNKTLPLDLIASNFLSNCTLNYFIDKEIKEELKESNVYLLHYTDDYVIISHDKEKIKEVIDKIKNKLEGMNLCYSYDKTLPTTVEDIVEKLDIVKRTNNWEEEHFEKIKEWFNFSDYGRMDTLISKLTKEQKNDLETKSLMIGIEIEPEEINREDIGKPLAISGLSTTSDVQIQALSDKELEIYMAKLMVYMQANGDIGELKEETAKIFAAWRLNASHQEWTYRKPYEIKDIKLFLSVLKKAIITYPYKLGFIDIYILLLIKILEASDSGFEELENFLINIKHTMKEAAEIDDTNAEIRNSSKFMSVTFPSVRIRILNLLSNNWKRFDEEKRIKLRSILENAFLIWYADPKVDWDELYVMYSSFFILRIRLPLEFYGISETHPSFLSDIAEAYKNYFFITTNKKKEVTFNTIMVAINMLKKGLYWNKYKKSYEFNEIEQLIYENLKSQLDLKSFNSYSRLAFTKIAPEKLKVKDWDILTNFESIEEMEKNNKEFIFEVLDFLQLNIQSYFEKPDQYSKLLEWAEQNTDEESENKFKIYVEDRFSSYQKIRSHFALTDERFSRLSENKMNNNDEIPIADWVFYCQTLPYHLETSSSKQKVLHPLTEYEFIKLLKKIKDGGDCNQIYDKDKNFTKNFYQKHSLLFKYTLTPQEWTRFRHDKKEDVSNPSAKGEEGKETEESTKEDTEKYVKVLFSLLTNRPWHTHVKQHFSMYKWNDLQSYFKMTYYPSTKVASLFVNHLNIHQDFYSKIYKMPLEELPYRYLHTKEDSNDISLWIENYLENQKNNQVYKTDNRKLELIEIDIDQLRS